MAKYLTNDCLSLKQAHGCHCAPLKHNSLEITFGCFKWSYFFISWFYFSTNKAPSMDIKIVFSLLIIWTQWPFKEQLVFHSIVFSFPPQLLHSWSEIGLLMVSLDFQELSLHIAPTSRSEKSQLTWNTIFLSILWIPSLIDQFPCANKTLPIIVWRRVWSEI